MDALPRFLGSLSLDSGDDSWSDEAITEAVQLAENLKSSDWGIISKNWMHYDVLIQARIANIASGINLILPSLIDMLVNMTSSVHVSVSENALSSLRIIAEDRPNLIAKSILIDVVNNFKHTGKIALFNLELLKKYLL